MEKSFVQLLEAFNSNSSNSEIVEYISRANIFDTIKKSRNEMVHSRMIAELLSGRYYELSRKQTLIHFLDIIIKRAQQQKKENIENAFKSSVLTRSLRIDSVNSNLEFMIKDYVNDEQKYNGKKRLDIFLDIKLAESIAVDEVKKEKVEIIIENKVLSHESSDQTKEYFRQCNKKEVADCFRFFVFLTPIASYELDGYEHLDEKDKPKNEHFIHICYQDILDYVISPLLSNDTINTRDRVILEEYVNCLELPAMPNKEDEKTEPSNRELSIMAVSKREKELLNDFWTDEDNKQLLNVVQAFKCNKQLFIYNNKYYTIDQLVPITITDYLEKNKESDTTIIDLLDKFKKIVIGKNRGTPFLVYGRKEQDQVKFIFDRNLYVFREVICGSLSKTLQYALNYSDSDNCQILNIFKNVYKTNGGGKLLFTDSIDKDFEEVTNRPGLFIRKGIGIEKLNTINEILKDKLGLESICPINDYHLQELLNDSKHVMTSYRHSKIPGKDIFYRKDQFNRINDIIGAISDLGYEIKEANMNLEKDLIESFFKNLQNQNLILSVYRIMMEVETSDEAKRANFTWIYKDLLKESKREEQNE